MNDDGWLWVPSGGSSLFSWRIKESASSVSDFSGAQDRRRKVEDTGCFLRPVVLTFNILIAVKRKRLLTLQIQYFLCPRGFWIDFKSLIGIITSS